MKRITNHGRLAAFNIGAILGIIFTIATLKYYTPIPLNATYDPNKYSNEEIHVAWQHCSDNFYDKDKYLDIAKEIITGMCKDFGRSPIPCVYTDVEAGDYKWRWLDKCTILELKKLGK